MPTSTSMLVLFSSPHGKRLLFLFLPWPVILISRPEVGDVQQNTLNVQGIYWDLTHCYQDGKYGYSLNSEENQRRKFSLAEPQLLVMFSVYKSPSFFSLPHPKDSPFLHTSQAEHPYPLQENFIVYPLDLSTLEGLNREKGGT